MKVLDYILIAVILISLILGYKRGFFGSITKPIKVIAAICLTVVVSTPILNAWTRPMFTEKVEVWIYDSLMSSLPESGAEGVTEALPAALKVLANLFKVDLSAIDTSLGIEAVINEISAQMAAPIGNLIAVVVTYVVLYVVFLLLLKIAIALLDAIFTTGWLGKINKFFGVLLGAVFATVICCIIVSIIGKISYETIEGPVSQFFRNFNPFVLVV